MLKKELVGSHVYCLEIDSNILVCDSNVEMLQYYKFDVFENDKLKEVSVKPSRSDAKREDDAK